MLYIAVPDMNDSISRLSIDGKEYGLRFTYNEKYDYWNFGLYDWNNNPIIAGVKIVPNFPLLHFFSTTDLPDGVFGCVSKMETVGRYAFKNKNAEFVYLPNEELEDE
jgi:hypothetical protein